MLLLELMKEFEQKDAQNFYEACNYLNEINARISTWESDYIESKEGFINRCKERRLLLHKEKEEMMAKLNKIETEKTNLILKEEGYEESKIL